MLREVEYDPFLRSQTKWITDADGEGLVAVATSQDVTDIVADAKRRYAQVDENARWGGDGDSLGAHVAEVPLSILYDPKEPWNDKRRSRKEREAAFKQWLNDRDNRCFRTRPGRV